MRVPTSREAAIRRREGRSEATQRRRIADERWVVASRRVKVKVKVVRLGKARIRWFLFLKIWQKVPPRHQEDPRLIFPKIDNLPNQNISR